MENWLSQPVFEGHSIRVTGTPENPWWILSDICRALELEAPHRTLARLKDDEHSTTVVEDALGRPQEMTTINESGVYRLIFMSRKPAAERFRLWVFREVLPSIRKTGRYEIQAYSSEWVRSMLGVSREKMEHHLERMIGYPDAQRYWEDRRIPQVTMWPLSFCADLAGRINRKHGRAIILHEAQLDMLCARERSTSRIPELP